MAREPTLAFAAVVGSFLVTNFIVQRSSAAVGALPEGIIYNSAPSIEHLASIRREVLEAELILAVCGALAVVVAWLLHREARARRALFEAHTP